MILRVKDKNLKKIGGVMKLGLDSMTKKAIFVFIFALVLQIPVSFIQGIVYERDNLREKAVREVSVDWGSEQKIGGPFLVLECTKLNAKEKDKSNRRFIILPENLNISSSLDTSVRKKGIYNATVYTGDIDLEGDIILPDEELLKDHTIDQVYLSLGITDNKGIEKVSRFEIDGHKVGVASGTESSLFGSGISTFIKKFKYETGRKISFKIDLRLRGSQRITFLPFGVQNDFEIKSPWKNPSFYGMLPASSKIDDNGFSAKWSITNLVRSYNQYFWEDRYGYSNIFAASNYDDFSTTLDGGYAGVKLYEGITEYNQINRAAKYGILFIMLSLLVVYIFEISSKKTTHYIQYGIVGFSLALFYLILLSLVEYLNFNVAYFLATMAVVIPNALYLKGITHSVKYGGGMFIFLCGIYAILYSILKMQNYSLLIGTALITVVVYILMYVTRNLDRFEKLDKIGK